MVDKIDILNSELDSIFEGVDSLKSTLSYVTHYIPVSQFGFVNELYEDVWEVAVHVAIASYTPYIASDKLSSLVISDDLILDVLNLDGRKSRVKSKVSSAIQSLISKGIIEKFNHSGDSYHIQQSLVNEKKEWFSFPYSVFMDIVNYDVSDTVKINMIGVYSSIATSNNNINLDRYNKAMSNTSPQDWYTRMNVLRSGVCFKSQDTLMNSIGIKSKKTYKKYLDMLFELKLIFIVQVVHPINTDNLDIRHTRVFNYYIKYEDRAVLYHYLKFMSNNNRTKNPLDILSSVFAYNPKSDMIVANEDFIEESKVDRYNHSISGGYVPNDMKDDINSEYGVNLEKYDDKYNPKTIQSSSISDNF